MVGIPGQKWPPPTTKRPSMAELEEAANDCTGIATGRKQSEATKAKRSASIKATLAKKRSA
jgi:hypothetical protein